MSRDQASPWRFQGIREACKPLTDEQKAAVEARLSLGLTNLQAATLEGTIRAYVAAHATYLDQRERLTALLRTHTTETP